ncbi:unnamed protein product [Withania somnifera]
MEGLLENDHGHHDLNMVMIKRRRTKRSRPPSPLTLTITTSSCSTVEGGTSATGIDGGGGSDELGDHGHVENSSSHSNNCGGIDDQIIKNTNQEEEDMANCLILLAQGHNYQKSSSQSQMLDVYQCKTCNRSFPSFQALGGHRASHKKPKTLEEVKNSKAIDHQQVDHNRSKLNDEDHVTTLSLQIPSNNNITTTTNNNNNNNKNKNRVHECSICGAEFTSGQALGGHMRRHRPLPVSIAIASSHSHEDQPHHHDQQIKNTRTFLSLDLNLPAPEDDHHRPPENSKFNFAAKEQVIVFSASPLVDCHY